MNTPLSTLWDRLIDIYNRLGTDSPEQCKNDIENCVEYIYSSEKLVYPAHLSVFLTALSNHCNIIDAAEQAAKCVGECGQCVVCRKCASKFYSILQKKLVERALPMEMADYFSNNSQLQYYVSAYENVKQSRDINNSLLCLKGFSSSTPMINSAVFSKNTCVGGGFYLNVNGFGVVIDPGIGFVENMHREGIFIEDINAVIVTHDHLDYNKDIGTISALQHDLNQYYKHRTRFYKKYFDQIDNPEHEISWWLDEGTQKNHESNKLIFLNSVGLSNCTEWTKLSEEISFMAFRTEHMKEGVSYGIKCRISTKEKEIVIGYTSDTRFFPELLEYLQEADIIIFNISDIYEKDIRGNKSKSNHLGYDGSVRILKSSKLSYQLAIASEFCCTNGDYRMKLVKKLREQAELNKQRNVIAGEVGMQVSLDKMKVVCSRCKCTESLSNVVVIAPECEFGKIEYICSQCREIG